MKNIVITGVSTGIGRASARDLIAQGAHVFGSVRKPADADRLKQELGDAFTPLLFDVTDEAAVAVGARQVREALNGATLHGLVNNAGVAVTGPLMHIPLEEIRRQNEINVVGLLSATQHFLPLLGAEKGLAGKGLAGAPGRIVNISSVSGERAMPFMGPYSISKFGVEALSESLRRELLVYGIDVIVVAPGPVKTEIWDKAEEADMSAYDDTDYAEPLTRLQKVMLEQGRKRGLPVEKIATTIREALFAPSPKTRYRVTPSYLRDVLMPSLMGPRMLDRMIGKALGIKKA